MWGTVWGTSLLRLFSWDLTSWQEGGVRGPVGEGQVLQEGLWLPDESGCR